MDDRAEDLNMSLELFSANFSLSSPEVSPSAAVGLFLNDSESRQVEPEKEKKSGKNEENQIESEKEKKNSKNDEERPVEEDLEAIHEEEDDGELTDGEDETDAETEEEEVQIKYTAEDLLAFNEIDEKEINEDIESFLRKTENNNTRDQTAMMICKYHRIMSVVAKKENKDFLPLDSTPVDQIPKLLARFFLLVRTKTGDIFNASSYTTYLGCFARHISDKYEIDIKKDPRFKILRTTIGRLKKKAQGTKGKKPGANASKVVAPRHLQMAWRCGSIGRNDPDALVAATYMAFTTGMGCRAVKEVLSVTNDAVVLGPINDKTGIPEYIELDEQWVAKNRNGDDPKILESKITADDEFPEICMVRTVCEMQRRKTDSQKDPEKRFFWNVNEAARKNPNRLEKWFKNQVMGKHTISAAFPNALSKAGIDVKKEKYTATSCRKVLLDGGLDAGIPEVLLGKLAGHKSETAKRQYIEKKDETHRAASIVTSRIGAGLEADYNAILKNVKQKDKDMLDAIKDSHDNASGTDEEEEHTISQSRILSEHGSIEVFQQIKKKSSMRTHGNSSKHGQQPMAGVQQNMAGNQHNTAGVQQANLASVQQENIASVQQNIVSVQQNMAGNQQNMQQNMAGVQQNMTGNQQNMMGMQLNMTGNQQNMIGMQQNMMGNQQNMMGNQQNMMGNQQNMIDNQQNIAAMQQNMMGVQRNMGAVLFPGTGIQRLGMSMQQSVMDQQILPHHLRNSVSHTSFNLGNTNNIGSQQFGLGEQLLFGNMPGSLVHQPNRPDYGFNPGEQLLPRGPGFQMNQQGYGQALLRSEHQRFGPRPGELPYLPWEHQLPNYVQGHLLREMNSRVGFDRVSHLAQLPGFENVLSHGYRPQLAHEQQLQQDHILLQRQQLQDQILFQRQQLLRDQQGGQHYQQQSMAGNLGQMQQIGKVLEPQGQQKQLPVQEQQLRPSGQKQQQNLPTEEQKLSIPTDQKQLSVNETNQKLPVPIDQKQLSVNKPQQNIAVPMDPKQPSFNKTNQKLPVTIDQKQLSVNKPQQKIAVPMDPKQLSVNEAQQKLPVETDPKQLSVNKRQRQILDNKEQNKKPRHTDSVIQKKKKDKQEKNKENKDLTSKSFCQEKLDSGESSRRKENVSNLKVYRTTSDENKPDGRLPGQIMLHKTRSQAWPVKINSIDSTGIGLFYFGTAQTGEVRGWSSLYEYNLENKNKFGLLKVNLKDNLKKAIEEADEEFSKE